MVFLNIHGVNICIKIVHVTMERFEMDHPIDQSAEALCHTWRVSREATLHARPSTSLEGGQARVH